MSISGGRDSNDKDIGIGHESEEEEHSESEKEEASPRRGAEDSGSNWQKTGGYFTDLSYLNSLSRQERQRIKAEISDGHKPGGSSYIYTQRSI
jgi:hypothetical protein